MENVSSYQSPPSKRSHELLRAVSYELHDSLISNYSYLFQYLSRSKLIAWLLLRFHWKLVAARKHLKTRNCEALKKFTIETVPEKNLKEEIDALVALKIRIHAADSFPK